MSNRSSLNPSDPLLRNIVEQTLQDAKYAKPTKVKPIDSVYSSRSSSIDQKIPSSPHVVSSTERSTSHESTKRLCTSEKEHHPIKKTNILKNPKVIEIYQLC